MIKNGRVRSILEVLAPFRTAEALAARQRDLEAYEKLCHEGRMECGAAGAHAH